MSRKFGLMFALTAAVSVALGAGAAQAASSKMCETVSAVAAGFGKTNVILFAKGNLDNAINSAKDRLAGKGAKGFVVSKRAVKCEGYIDFGAPLGRETKCTATAQLCGK